MFELYELLRKNPHYGEFRFTSNGLYYQNHYLDFNGFSVENFLTQNSKFVTDIGVLTPEAIFHILDIHVKENKMRQQQLNEVESFEQLKPLSPEIKDIRLIQKKDERGLDKTYIYYIDQYGVNHILYKYAPTDILQVYRNLLLEKKGAITEKDLFEALERKMKNVSLETLDQASKVKESSESHINQLKDAEFQHMTRQNAFGNQEHDLYVNGDGEILSYHQKENGDMEREEHSGGHFVSESSTELEQTTTSMETEVTQVVSFISFNEYENFILTHAFLTEEEQKKVELFENFLFDLIVYQEYLSPNLQQILFRYYHLMETVAVNSNLSQVSSDALTRFYDMKERSKHVTIQNVSSKIRTLEKQTDSMDQAGFLSYVLFFFLLFLCIALFVAGILLAL